MLDMERNNHRTKNRVDFDNIRLNKGTIFTGQ